jgi:prolipoprotein diacylglyceryltransferase
MLPTIHWHLAHWHLAISLYHAMLALAVVVALAIAVRRSTQPDAVLIVAPLALVAAMAAAEWWHVALHAAPGLSSMGGVAGALVTIAVVAPLVGRSRRELLDAMAPAALVGFAIGRVGCFCAGCCYGTPTTLSWGVVIDALGPPGRHPVQLVEAVLDLVAAGWAGRGRGLGIASGRAMLGYAVVRLVVEPLRDPVSADVVGRVAPSAVYWCAAALAVMGAWLLARRDGRPTEGLAWAGGPR